MGLAGLAISLAVACLLGPAVFADCIDYSEARAAKAGAALEANPPSAAQLGVPNLDGFKLNGAATTGDPKCGGPNPPSTYVYTANLGVRDLVTAYYAYVQPFIEEDGMKRKWYRNPYWSKGLFALTSGTEIGLSVDAAGKISSIRITPAPTVLPLTAPGQPYSVEDMIISTPWPGGPDGPKEFVRADDPAGGAPAASTGTSAAASANPGNNANSTPASSNCQPKPDGDSGGGGEDVGAEVGGRVLGGGFGRSVGGTLGGLFGKPKQPPPADPDCP